MEWTARRHALIFGAAGMLAVLATQLLAMLRPPMLTSNASVVVAGTNSIQTEALIAGSDLVLQGAIRSDPALSLAQLVHVQVVPAGRNLLMVTASATTATEAEGAANAVARSYVAFIKSPGRPAGDGQVRAAVLDQALLRHGLVYRRGWRRLQLSGCWWVQSWV